MNPDKTCHIGKVNTKQNKMGCKIINDKYSLIENELIQISNEYLFTTEMMHSWMFGGCDNYTCLVQCFRISWDKFNIDEVNYFYLGINEFGNGYIENENNILFYEFECKKESAKNAIINFLIDIEFIFEQNMNYNTCTYNLFNLIKK